MKYLVTQTLLNSYNYIFNCFDGGEQDALAEFIKTLNREKTEPNEAMQRGIDFENLVLDFTKDPDKYAAIDKEFDNTAIEIGKIVYGAQWQVKAYKDKTIDGINFLLMAKCDCVKAGEIFDIKRVDNYDVGKYQESPQHPMYMEVIPAFKFTYLVSDGKDVYREEYTRENTPSVDGHIRNMIQFLKSENLFDTFCEKWRAD